MYRWAKKYWFNDFGAYDGLSRGEEAQAKKLQTALAGQGISA